MAGHRRVQHALAHVSAKRRLMAASAAGNQADLASGLFGPGDDFNALAQIPDLRVGLGHAPEHIADNLIGIVDDFFHSAFSPSKR